MEWFWAWKDDTSKILSYKAHNDDVAKRFGYVGVFKTKG